MPLKNIRRLSKRFWEAKRQLDEAVQSDLPPGTRVQWDVGGYVQTGHVTHAPHSRAVFVNNDKTGKNVRLDVSRLIDAD